MNNPAELFIATTKSNIESLESLTKQAFSGFEKLVELNLDASRAVLNESISHTRSVMEIKDAQTMLNLQANFLQSLAEKSAAYGQHLYTVVTGTSADFTKTMQSKMNEAQAKLV